MADINTNLSRKTKKKRSIFTYFEKALSLRGFLNRLPQQYIPKLLFVFGIGLCCVAKTHYCNKLACKLSKLESEVEDLAVDYIILNANYTCSIKRSEIARRVAEMGLEIPDHPPYKIKNPNNWKY